MSRPSKASLNNDQRRAAARRFLRTFITYVSIVALIVASINLIGFRYMVRDDNQAIVQLLAGWGRMYKPILHDKLEPDVLVLGASWARDAFDPIETGRLLGQKVFNHGVSGGTVYEVRRFAESALVNPNLKSAIVNLDTIYRDRDARTKYGFDENILNVDPDNNPNRWVGLKRAYSVALTGWAIAANIELVLAILARDNGDARADYLESYQRADLTKRHAKMERARQRIFPPSGYAPQQAVAKSLSPFQEIALQEFEMMIDGFCENGVDTYAYFSAFHMWTNSCDAQARFELSTLEFLRHKQTSCAAKLSYFNFNYPNVVTLEGMLSPVTHSTYYRPDGHPRPTLGLLMAASMFDVEFPADSPDALQSDFGVDLLSHPDAEGWLLERAARCGGDWGEGGYAAFKPPLATP